MKRIKTMLHSRAQSITALLVIVAMVIAGVHFVVRSHAQSPYVPNTADAGTVTPLATVQTCTGSSDGSCVQFGYSPAEYVSRQGQALRVKGQNYTFMGINMYYANIRNSCAGYNDGNNTDEFAKDLATYNTATGGNAKVIRAWFTQVQVTTNGELDWSAFDHTLDAAQAAGFKVIPVLANQWGVCDNSANVYNDYHTLSWYQTGYKTAPDMSGPLSYRQYVQDVVTRYKNNPTILAWQLINEGNAGTTSTSCPSESVASQALVSWATDITSLIKANDPNHLVDIDPLDNSCGSYGADNTTLEAVPDNDICDFHDYGNPTVPIPTDLQYMLTACQGLHKPIMIGETGITFDQANNDLATRASLFNAKFSAEYKAGVVGILPWVWNGSGTVIDNLFEIDPDDPTLAVMAQY